MDDKDGFKKSTRGKDGTFYVMTYSIKNIFSLFCAVVWFDRDPSTTQVLGFQSNWEK